MKHLQLKLSLFICCFIFHSPSFSELKELEKLSNLEPLQKPATFSVGNTWKALKNGSPFETTVISASVDAAKWKTNDGCIQQNSNEIFAMCIKWENCSWGADGGSSSKLKGESWPLIVGKKWKYKINGQGWATTRSCKVTDAVKVSTGLGEFDTYKVECKDTWNKEVWYMDTKTGNIVYQSYKNTHSKVDDKFETTQFPR